MIVAETILQQIGGNRFIAMTGANRFVGTENSLKFYFKMNQKMNLCVIELNSWDLYDMTFYQYSKKNLTAKEVKKETDVYNDQLQKIFTSITGLDTHL